MNAGYKISGMTLGTVQIGMNYGIANKEGQPDEEKAFKILDAALDNGISCLDTAAAYGSSEKIIGKYFRSVRKKRPEISIITKFRLGNVSLQETERVIMKAVEQSVTNLDTGCLDILLLHDPNDYKTHGKEITVTFEKLLSGGIIKRAGASCYEFSEIEPMLQNDIFSAFQIPVNLLDEAVHSPEESGRFRNRLIFARSIFLQGLFFMDPADLKGNLRDAGSFIKRIREIAAEMNISVTELAIGYVRSLDFVDSLVIGADNPGQVEENVKFFKTEPFTPALMDSIRERLSGVPGWLLKPYLWDIQKNKR